MIHCLPNVFCDGGRGEELKIYLALAFAVFPLLKRILEVLFWGFGLLLSETSIIVGKMAYCITQNKKDFDNYFCYCNNF